MVSKKKVKSKNGVRFDSKHIRLRTGESEKDNGTYVYRWTDKVGKRHAVYAPTLADLREQEEQIIVDRHDGIKTNVKNITVNDLFDLWVQVKRGVKDSTMKNYIYMYEMFVKPTFGKKKLTQVKKSDVRRFYNQLVDERILKISTLDGIHNVLHQVFAIAVDDDMTRNNPTDNMLRELKSAHGHEVEKRKALTVEQERIFLEYLRNSPRYNHWYPVFYIMANTGMRVGEITGLRWCDVDFKTGLINVNHTLVYYNHRDEHGCYFSINTPKTKAGIREIPMTEGVVEAFKMEKEYQEENNIISVSHIEGYSDFIFVNRFGEVQHQGTLNKALRRIMRDCNGEILENNDIDDEPVLLPCFSCHVLRHPYVKHTTKIFSLRLMDFQAQAYPDARQKTRGACQLLRVGQSRSPVRPLCNRKRFSCLPPQSKMSWILYAISMRLSGYTSTRSISSSASSVVSVSASKIALDASLRLSCRACSSCFFFACANTAA